MDGGLARCAESGPRPWYPGVVAADPWAGTLSTLIAEEMRGAGARHHCYELTIGVSHLGGYLWTNDEHNLRIAQQRLGEILERGELPLGRSINPQRRPCPQLRRHRQPTS